jgi:hypothetical protein
MSAAGAKTRKLVFADRLAPEYLAMVVTVGVASYGVYQVVLALWMAVAPHSFFKQLGPFGVFNEHYIRDLATYSAAIGAALLVAIRRISWRVPVLALATLQNGLHSINHIIDIEKAHPAWIGYLDVVTLVGTTVLLYWLTRAAQIVERESPAEAPQLAAVPELTSADN